MFVLFTNVPEPAPKMAPISMTELLAKMSVRLTPVASLEYVVVIVPSKLSLIVTTVLPLVAAKLSVALALRVTGLGLAVTMIGGRLFGPTLTRKFALVITRF